MWSCMEFCKKKNCEIGSISKERNSDASWIVVKGSWHGWDWAIVELGARSVGLKSWTVVDGGCKWWMEGICVAADWNSKEKIVKQ
jgi:hypothetical protein